MKKHLFIIKRQTKSMSIDLSYENLAFDCIAKQLVCSTAIYGMETVMVYIHFQS